MNKNRLIIAGRIGQEPEMRIVGNTKVLSFSVAVNESWTKDGEKKEKTTWVNCQAWGNTADFINKYSGKGLKIYLEGKYEIQVYESGGEKKYSHFLRVNDRDGVDILEWKNKTEGNGNSVLKSANAKAFEDSMVKDLPF